uniref:Uncharacterized protein n=1 Tax=Glossina brevipalpis TaxID=37001 RepID=A0A1A9WW07_9MUSC
MSFKKKHTELHCNCDALFSVLNVLSPRRLEKTSGKCHLLLFETVESEEYVSESDVKSEMVNTNTNAVSLPRLEETTLII